MGFDLTGKSGNYFRANCWSWRPIMSLIDDLNEELNLGDLTGWNYNDGEGLRNQQDCDKLANAIEKWLENGIEKLELVVAGGMSVDENGRFLERGKKGGKTPYSTDKEHLLEFVLFLRNCGGSFEIW